MITDLVVSFSLLFASVLALIAAVYVALGERKRLERHQIIQEQLKNDKEVE